MTEYVWYSPKKNDFYFTTFKMTNAWLYFGLARHDKLYFIGEL